MTRCDDCGDGRTGGGKGQSMKITLDLLRAMGACADGLAWFEAKLGAEADYQAALDLAVADSRIEWACWALSAIGGTNDVTEVDGATETRAHVVVAGTLKVRGSLCVSGRVAAGSGIKAGWGIKAGEGIKAGYSIHATLTISARLRIFAGLVSWRLPTAEETEIVARAVTGTIAHGAFRALPSPSGGAKSLATS